MAQACLEDLRKRFCRALERGMSVRAAARHLEVSESTGVKWAQRRRATGKVAAKPMGGCKPLPLAGERDWLLPRLARACDPTLAALV
jgi:putative transposase